jgi:hypothetical protein
VLYVLETLTQTIWSGSVSVAIWMTNYNSGEEALRKAIGSVLSQTYQDWTLYIADNYSPDPTQQAVIEEARSKDERVVQMEIPPGLAGIPLMRHCWDFISTLPCEYSITLGGHDAWDDNCLSHLVTRMTRTMFAGERTIALVYPETYQMDADGKIFGVYINNDTWSHPEIPTLPIQAITSVSSPQLFGLWSETVRRTLPVRHCCSGWDHLIVAEAALHGQVLYEPQAKLIMRCPPPGDSLERYGLRHLTAETLASGPKDFYAQLEWLAHMNEIASYAIPDANRPLFRQLAFNSLVETYIVLRGRNLSIVPGALEAFAADPDVGRYLGTSVAMAELMRGKIATALAEPAL